MTTSPPSRAERRFLATPHREQVALASFPRSGNSLMRDLIETVTRIVTGSDTKPTRGLSRQLREAGLAGEGRTDETVWIIKTHWPERKGVAPFAVAKAVVLVRNPFDCLDSYFNMVLTSKHNSSVDEATYEQWSGLWNEFVQNEAKVWSKFHRFWISKRDGRAGPPLPVHFIRYEDVMERREEVLHGLLQSAPQPFKLRNEPIIRRESRTKRTKRSPREHHLTPCSTSTSTYCRGSHSSVKNRNRRPRRSL